VARVEEGVKILSNIVKAAPFFLLLSGVEQLVDDTSASANLVLLAPIAAVALEEGVVVLVETAGTLVLSRLLVDELAVGVRGSRVVQQLVLFLACQP
jgi:hypothetical protein